MDMREREVQYSGIQLPNMTLALKKRKTLSGSTRQQGMARRLAWSSKIKLKYYVVSCIVLKGGDAVERVYTSDVAETCFESNKRRFLTLKGLKCIQRMIQSATCAGVCVTGDPFYVSWNYREVHLPRGQVT